MKILFIFGNAYSKQGSNANIAYLMIEKLKKEHEICIVSKIDEEYSFPKYVKKDGISYYFIRPFSNYEFIARQLVENEDWQGKSIRKKIFWGLKHPSIVLKKLIYFIQEHDDFEKDYLKGIIRMNKRFHFDRIIAVSAPYSTARAMAKAKVSSKKILYQLDPHYTNYYMKNHRKALKEEKKVLKNIDLAIMTDLIYKENEKNLLSVYINKMRLLNYPNIRDLNLNNDFSYFDKKKINCCFIGSFYEEIRNPYFMLKIFSHMKNKNIILHLIGGGCESTVKKFEKIMGEKLCVHGYKSLDLALNYMMQADILVSLNNKIRNQVPGKIFDYISTGKPILNFCFLKNCPTLEYMKKYPMSMNIFYKQHIDISAIETFICNFKGKRITYEIIKEIYRDFTVDVVGENFKKMIEKC